MLIALQRRGLHLQSVHIIIKLAIVARSDVSLELAARVRRDGRLSGRVRNLYKCMLPAHSIRGFAVRGCRAFSKNCFSECTL